MECRLRVGVDRGRVVAHTALRAETRDHCLRVLLQTGHGRWCCAECPGEAGMSGHGGEVAAGSELVVGFVTVFLSNLYGL